ncbi:thioesterase-like superfamily-domain-containing protein [Phascolomyces articulosus]|uniref:Thioesterase-like superfamily-domain-containing protein n=1 Tax=Phascolomyces articulosus TaxID=60185 RepID=A0AAD5P7I0_9FUNG|nr:thioesterase-like superfamily-domain-containing protein [Phascolomyces articulosus]
MSNSSSSTISTNHNNDTIQDQTPEDLKMARALTVEELDVDIYRNSEELWHPISSRGAYGGQLVAQALRAAWHTVPEEFHVHSLHNYFLVPGRSDVPAIYQVKRVRDGRSFVTRVVTCTQQGKTVIVCICSFTPFNNVGEESMNHQTPMPSNIPKPEDLPTDKERMEKLSIHPSIPEKHRKHLEAYSKAPTPIDYRDIEIDTAQDFLVGTTEPSQHRGQWFKAQERLPDNDPALHACSIAYASDRGILMGALRANGIVGRRGISMMASIDHSIWFHALTRADEWLFYDVHSPRSNDGRGTAFGRIYNRQGVLVATCSQEGIIRLSQSQQDRRKPKTTKL